MPRWWKVNELRPALQEPLERGEIGLQTGSSPPRGGLELNIRYRISDINREEWLRRGSRQRELVGRCSNRRALLPGSS